ncbi:MAG: CDP-diacylglycerol--glycerol-3-phosphate 3-phosphatidyltransferase [Elusimicrobia bacterium RIFCSPHIGHO2_02_FULL_57_9]|nr:MAG: CDP-diacylglycerol--glycerol-3-phosphate 3-phosphatidyltransferase [Elusimicrobia bacterium RIFCSPHIGHO2_02_FULL_57_9]
MNLANRLTMLRIALALAMFPALLHRESLYHLIAFFLCLAAVITDFIDGRLARITRSISPFGKVADPIADKILIVGALIALTRTELNVPHWGVFLIIARELLIDGLRLLNTAYGKLPGAQPWGKLKMGIQSVCVLAMIAVLIVSEHMDPVAGWLMSLPYYLTVICVIAAWNSAYHYFRQSREALEKSWG